jgi:hypothetical protein
MSNQSRCIKKMSGYIPDTILREPVFKKLPKCLHTIIWDYIGCVCNKEHFIWNKKFNTLVNYYDECCYRHNHMCSGSPLCKRNLQSKHKNICQVFNISKKRDPMLIYYKVPFRQRGSLFSRKEIR